MVRNYANNQYTFQEFLLDCPYDSILIENYAVVRLEELQDHQVAYNLFDCFNGIVRRTIALSELDQFIDTEDDFILFIENHRWINELIIIDDRPQFENPILSNYSINTLKAYLYRIQHAGISCGVWRNKERREA